MRPRWAEATRSAIAFRTCGPKGLSYAAAAHKLHYLLTHARRLGLTGVGLKDDSDALLASTPTTPAVGDG